MKNIRRRTFLKNTVVAGIGTSLTGPSLAGLSLSAGRGPENPSPRAGGSERPTKSKKIIVAGAGISGLCCAYELMKRGHEVFVLEASGRHGGHVFTGRDGLSDGLYADFGADHITKPGYERFFEYVDEFNLAVLPYPHAEGSTAAPGGHMLRMIDGKFYTEEMLADPVVLGKFGFNDREIRFLATNPRHDFPSLFVKSYLGKFTDEMQPFGVGYDELDKISLSDLYKKEGASPAALRILGGQGESALYSLWRLAVMGFRGIPLSEGDTYRLKGGNQELPTAFARKLGDRVKLNHPILSIRRSDTGVSVTYKAFGYAEEKEMSADVLVNCIPLPVFRKIPVTPALSAGKQYVVDNLGYSSHPFYVFEASSKFWLEDGFKSINMEFEHPDISSIWQASEPVVKTGGEGERNDAPTKVMGGSPGEGAGKGGNGAAGQSAPDVESSRIILKAYGPGGVSAQRGLAAFREVYPGKHDTIVQALTVDWTKDKYSPTCEMLAFPVGEMHKFWPELIKPDGRIYFAGTYADTLSRGMESCLRSAQRVAKEIDPL